MQDPGTANLKSPRSTAGQLDKAPLHSQNPAPRAAPRGMPAPVLADQPAAQHLVSGTKRSADDSVQLQSMPSKRPAPEQRIAAPSTEKRKPATQGVAVEAPRNDPKTTEHAPVKGQQEKPQAVEVCFLPHSPFLAQTTALCTFLVPAAPSKGKKPI